MVFPPVDRRKAVMSVFPCFKLNGIELKYVNEFKYLGHIINNDERDDKDVLRLARDTSDVYTYFNILARRFSLCSVSVKIALFGSFCICFYGMEVGTVELLYCMCY